MIVGDCPALAAAQSRVQFALSDWPMSSLATSRESVSFQAPERSVTLLGSTRLTRLMPQALTASAAARRAKVVR